MKVKVQRGFTLIEILVVVAIMAVLAALLFPVFGHAKRKGFEATAISNAQQLFTAIQLYVNDSDSRYPIEEYQLAGTHMIWTQTVGSYISKFAVSGPAGQVLEKDLPGIFFDPGKPRLSVQFPGRNVGTWGIDGWGLSDDISNQYSPVWDKDGVPAGPPRKDNEVVSPSECVLLAETICQKLQTCPGSSQAVSPIVGESLFGGGNTDIDAPYGGYGPITLENLQPGGANATLNAFNVTLYCDGHVKPTRLRDLISDGTLWSITHTKSWP